jgi:drug/metabolite transporter (DMT)-like permease
MNKTLSSIWAMIIAATFFWGSNFNAARELADKLPPLTAASERFGIAVAVLLLMRLFQRQSESILFGRDMAALCALGMLGVFGFNFAFFAALHTTSALNGALIMSLSPLVTVLLSTILLDTQLRAVQMLGIAVAFVGVALVITGGHWALLHVAIGDLWMLCACLSWSLYNVLVRKYIQHVPSSQQARWTISAGALALIVLALVLERPIGLIVQLDVSTHLILIYMALCGTVLAYIFWLRGLQALGPQRASIAFNLVPVFTLLINLALGEPPKLAQFLGMALVFSGVLISTGWRPQFLGAKNKLGDDIEA